MGRKRSRGQRHKPTRSVRRPGLLGIVRLTDRGGVVETAEGRMRLAGRSLREVMDGDTVSVSLHRGPRGERRALVESVIERSADSFVGTYEQAGPLGVVRPLDARSRADFFMPPEDASAENLGVVEGDVVCARIVSYPTRLESGVVTIERRIGGADARDAGIWCVMARYGLEEGYPEAALVEAEALELDVEAALEDPLRRDIRDRFVVTIDPVDARDFDDAISLEEAPGGGILLGVHIADVSHYVDWGSSIDLEARSRATSVYLADRVLPMLPERLSCDLCSLVAGEDRLAVTIDIELDPVGHVRRYEAYPSVIRSSARLSYEQADELMRDGAGEGKDEGEGRTGASRERDVVPVGGASVAELIAAAEAHGVDLRAFLARARDRARARMAIRYARGAVDFETVEVHAVLDERGYPVDLVGRERTEATGLIEEAMLVANECVADLLSAEDLVCAYRVHEPPSPDHLHDAAHALIELDAIPRDLARAIALGDRSAMRTAIERSHGTGASEAVNALLLRSMKRAVYKPRNEGHYALGAPAYCHFTSPIRRYPDLVVHRALKMELARRLLGARAARDRARRLVGTGGESLENVIAYICRRSSERERVADAASRASQKVEAARYYSERVGERVAGTICWMDAAGAFVRLDGTHAEGLVRMADLGGERFDFDERTLTASGCSTGAAIRLGDRVIVEVASTNPVRGHINLRLVHRMRALH